MVINTMEPVMSLRALIIDVTSSWGTLRNQISAGLNFSLSCIPYWNSDIGGFFLSRFPRKLEDPEYRELYVRWLELEPLLQ